MAKYEDVTIANVEEVIKTGYMEEIICDADKKEIYEIITKSGNTKK